MLSESEPRESASARVAGRIGEVLLDAQQLVVLGDPLATRRGAGLDLAGVRCDGEVGDERVVGLTGAVTDHAREPGTVGKRYRIERLADGTDLVDLDKQGVGRLSGDTAAQAFRVGDEEVVADHLDPVP